MKIRKRTTKKLVGLLLIIIFSLLAQYTDWLDRPTEIVKQAQPGHYRVVSIQDGDTITVDMNGTDETVRLIGIDTPETKDPRKPVQCFGEAATQFTTQLIGQSDVRLESDPLSTNRDRYDRLLRYVYLPDGRMVNKELIGEGYGFAYLSFPFTKSEEFRMIAQTARELNKGLWSSCNPELDGRGFISTGNEL